ncbi:MAG TPA: hypothetical protein VHX86_17150 [Tepidisphaeraceae bacterium]|jgi:hypothetical protein|nr:hypothetical protein [Tepidisphaeraceae bacterium]
MIWHTALGLGADLMTGLLVTDGSPLPRPICFVSGVGRPSYEFAEGIIRGTEALTDAIDYTLFDTEEIVNHFPNLLYPSGRTFREADQWDDRAGRAGRYIFSRTRPHLLGFEILTDGGLFEVLRAERSAEPPSALRKLPPRMKIVCDNFNARRAIPRSISRRNAEAVA